MTEAAVQSGGEPDAARPRERVKLGRRIRRATRRPRRVVYGWAYRFWYWSLPKLPLWAIGLLGRLLIVPVTRLLFWRTAERNLLKVYGDELTAADRKRILTGVFRGMSRFLVECMGSLKQGPDFFQGRVDDSAARERLIALEERSPKGWIGVSPHLGNWVLMASWTGTLPGGRGQCHAIAKRQPNPYLSTILEDAMRRMGFIPVYGNNPPMQVVGECLNLLKRGCRMGIAPDQDSSRAPGVFIDFLGHRAYTPSGPAQLALAVGVPLVPVAFVRKGEKFGSFEVLCGEPIYPDQNRSCSRAEETLRLTKAWSAALEEMIHDHKDQWMWFHERWKTTPADVAEGGHGRQ